MRTKNYVCRIGAAICTLLLVACIDDSFRLDEVSKEITIGQDSTTTLPIGYLEKMTLGEMIDVEDIDELTIDENGNYAIHYAGDTKSVEIEGVTSSFDIPKTSTSFMVTYPSLDIESEPVELHEAPTVAMDIEKYNIGGGTYFIPDGVTVPINGEFHNQCTLENIHFDVPEQISEIKYVLLENGEYGAPIRASLDVNSLSAINGGGKVNFDITLSGASFTLRDENGDVHMGNTFQREYEFSSGEEEVVFEVFVEKINDLSEIENGVLDIPIELEYNLTFEMNTQSGTFILDELPTLNFDASIDYKDADVELDGEKPIIEYHEKGGNTIKVSGLPDEIKSISRISLNDNMEVTLFAHGLEWLQEMADLIELDIILPNYLLLHSIPNVDYSYNEDSHLLNVTLEELSHGLNIGIEAIDFTDNKIIPESGEIEIDFAPDIVVHFTDHAEVLVSSLLENGGSEIAFETGLEEATLEVKAVSGNIAYNHEHNELIEITGLDEDLDIEIEGSGLSPIIAINLSNPLTLTANIDAQLTPMRDDAALDENAISIHDIAIAPATYVDGEIVNGQTHLILADESRRDEFASEGYTFVACNIDDLLCGKLPDSMMLSLLLSTDGDVTSEIYITKDCSFIYDYNIDIPIAFSNELSASYADSVNDLADVFEDITEYDIKVGDITIIADIANTTPLMFSGTAEFIDKDGKATDVKVILPEGGITINGSKDGVSEATSQVRLGFDIPGGEIRSLANIDGINFSLHADGVSQSNIPLSDKQYVTASLKLELTGGVTVDIDSLTE